jgi:hypothetical protein
MQQQKSLPPPAPSLRLMIVAPRGRSLARCAACAQREKREREADECGAIGHRRASARVIANHGPLIQISGED